MRTHIVKLRRSLNISDLVHDVEDVRIVINLDYPPQAEDYIHRIGRTARSGAKGTAYSFFTRENAKQANELIQVLKDSNQEVNEKLYELSRFKHFGGSGRGGHGFRGGFDRRGPPSYRNDDRNNNNSHPSGRPTRFSSKRSRSRSPSNRPSRFDSRDGNGYSNHSGDYKRARTDHSRSTHDDNGRQPYSSATNGSSSHSNSSNSKSQTASVSGSATSNPYSNFYTHIASYPPPAMYTGAYQMYAQASAAGQQPPLPSGPPPPPPAAAS